MTDRTPSNSYAPLGNPPVLAIPIFPCQIVVEAVMAFYIGGTLTFSEEKSNKNVLVKATSCELSGYWRDQTKDVTAFLLLFFPSSLVYW